jgi:hypothetical protein
MEAARVTTASWIRDSLYELMPMLKEWRRESSGGVMRHVSVQPQCFVSLFGKGERQPVEVDL